VGYFYWFQPFSCVVVNVLQFQQQFKFLFVLILFFEFVELQQQFVIFRFVQQQRQFRFLVVEFWQRLFDFEWLLSSAGPIVLGFV